MNVQQQRCRLIAIGEIDPDINLPITRLDPEVLGFDKPQVHAVETRQLLLCAVTSRVELAWRIPSRGGEHETPMLCVESGDYPLSLGSSLDGAIGRHFDHTESPRVLPTDHGVVSIPNDRSRARSQRYRASIEMPGQVGEGPV